MLARFYISILFITLLQGVFAQVDLVQENQAGISRRLQFEIDITKDPKLGFVPKYRLLDAYRIKDEKIQEARARRANQSNALLDPNQGNKTTSSSSTTTTSSTSTSFSITALPEQLSWIERGPYADAVGPSNGNTRAGNAVTSGRVRAIWEDITNSNIVWVGGIDGGLWKTDNFNDAAPIWTSINEKFTNMAISSICQDPTSPLILYFGTGEKTINADAVRGAGVWMSKDGGVTWGIMPGTESFWNVSKVACDKDGNLYVGCNALNNTSGLQRYTKSTFTWTNITPSGLDPRIPDFEISSNNKLHVSCGYYNTSSTFSGYRFTATPATVNSSTWTNPSTTFPTQYNVDISSNGDVLYALSSDASWQIPKIYKSINGGVNWTATSRAPATGWASGQAWYSMAIAVNPLNVNQVIVGGLDCYRTTDGGSTWSKVSAWVGTTGQYVHADQHIMTWNKSNRIVVGNDGGVFVSTDGGSTFKDKNSGLRIKQFYSVAIHPAANTDYFIGGTQDNGVHQIKEGGATPSSIEVTGGDGAFTIIDQDQPQYQWGSYVYNQYRRSTDGGVSWTSINYSNTSGRFINPIDYDNIRNIMYCSGSSSAFLIWSNPQTGTTTSFTSATFPSTVWNGGTVSAVKVSPYTSNTVFFAGGGNGSKPSIVRVDNANSTSRTFKNIASSSMQIFSGTNISSINLGNNDNEIIVTFSNYGIENVWVTYDGGTSWSPIDGDLPNMPVRWAMFHPEDSKRIIIATETGVWQTNEIIGSSTLWYPEDKFPNVRVDMLQYRKSDRLIAAATHGRGIFTAVLQGTAVPSCGNVTGLLATDITSTSATLNWSTLSGASSYDVDFAISGTTNWTNVALGTTALSTTLSSLTAATTYIFRARANCNGTLGSYTESSFVTIANTTTCSAPTGLSATNITSNSAVVNWLSVSGAQNYTVEYKATSTTTWLTAGSAISTLNTTINNLVASTAYDYRVRANCSSTSFSTFTQAQFTTSAPTNTSCETVADPGSTISTSSLISVNLDYKGLISSSTDIDFYKINITKTGSASINLTTLPTNYRLDLYNTSSALIASANKTGTSSELISYTFTSIGNYYIRVQGVSGAFNASNCYTLKVTTGTAAGTLQEIANSSSAISNSSSFSRNENANQSFKLFPNPAQDKLTIYMVSDNSAKTLQLYDTKGRVVYGQQISEMFTTLDVHKLISGIYFVRIIGENGTLIHQEKILKH